MHPSRIHHSWRAGLLAAATVLPFFVPIASATAQPPCAERWLPFGQLFQPNATAPWDPDGAGPAGPLVAFSAGFNPVNSPLVFSFDSVDRTWSQVGTIAPTGRIRALLGRANGDLAAAGRFSAAGLESVLLWDGVAWTPVPGLAETTASTSGGYALAELPNGNLVVGGSYFGADGVFQFDGTVWTPIPGIPSANALVTLRNGNLVAGGPFTLPGGLSGVAVFDGTVWMPLGAGVAGTVDAVVELPNGDIVVGGTFATAGGVPASNIARFDGVAWSPLAAGTDGAVTELTALRNGDILAGGSFSTAGAFAADGVAIFDGTIWRALGDGMTFVDGVGSLPDGTPVAIGRSLAPNTTLLQRPYRFDGTAWRCLAPGLSVGATDFATMPDGSLLAAGIFSEAGQRLDRRRRPIRRQHLVEPGGVPRRHQSDRCWRRPPPTERPTCMSADGSTRSTASRPTTSHDSTAPSGSPSGSARMPSCTTSRSTSSATRSSSAPSPTPAASPQAASRAFRRPRDGPTSDRGSTRPA